MGDEGLPDLVRSSLVPGEGTIVKKQEVPLPTVLVHDLVPANVETQEEPAGTQSEGTHIQSD